MRAVTETVILGDLGGRQKIYRFMNVTSDDSYPI